MMPAPRLSKPLAIGSQPWRDQVRMKLLDGYGIEDIAIWLDCHRSHVAEDVRRLRAEGWLKKWWSKK